MLARRKNRSLSTAAEALWEVVRLQAARLTALRENDPCIRNEIIAFDIKLPGKLYW